MSRIYFEARIKTLLRFTKKLKVEIGITFVDDKEMKRLNTLYRQKPQTTDVLSFSLNDPTILGDIVVSLDVAKKQAKLAGIALRELVCILIVHGYLHLLGYDHQKKSEMKQMRAQEGACLKKILGTDQGLISLETKIH